MRFPIVSAAIIALSSLGLVQAQTFSDCNPMIRTDCRPDKALGKTINYDFTQLPNGSDDWKGAIGTKMEYDSTDGAKFIINSVTDAPTLALSSYIMWGNVQVITKAAMGKGIVSSFILLSDDLDEIDWEWLGTDNGNVQSNFFGKDDTTDYNRAAFHGVDNSQGKYTNYTINWTKDAIDWYIDNTKVRTLAYTDPLTKAGTRYPQTPMQVKMGNWVGCPNATCFANDPPCEVYGTCQWAGGYYGQENKGPFTMPVKSVRVQDYSCGTEYSYGDQTGSYESIKGIDSSCSGNNNSTSGGSSSTTTTSTGSGSANTGTATGTGAGSSGTDSSGVLQIGKPGVGGAAGPSGGSGTASGIATSTGTSSGSGSGSGSGGSGSGSGAGVGVGAGAGGAGSGQTATGSSSSATGSQITANSAIKTQFGFTELAVVVLGLGFGYLIV